MALSFLDALSFAGNIYGQRQANKAVSKYNVPTQAEQQSAQLYAALADPNSSLMQKFTKEEQAMSMSDFLSQLRGMQNADRRQQSMGRSPTFFNPERADEAVSFLTSRGLPRINQMASEAAQNRILRAASGIQSNQGPQAQRLQTGMQQGVSNAAYKSQIPQQIANIFNSSPATPNLTTTNYINAPAQDVFGRINWNGA